MADTASSRRVPTSKPMSVAPSLPVRPNRSRTQPRSHDFSEEVIRDCQHIVILTEGYSAHQYAKTAIQLMRYRPHAIAAVLDSNHSGSTAEHVFGVGGSIPIVGDLEEVARFDGLFVGIAPPGGTMPAAWRGTIARAVQAGAHVVSGLHTHLQDDTGLVELAAEHGVTLVDVRASAFRRVATQPEFRRSCVRIQTVGTDCSVGKMSAAKEIELGLLRRGRDAAFVATGQTGVMISGRGITIDSVIADFVNGAAEQLVLDHQHHEVLMIEGQGSIVHPAFSGVTMGLLHGAAPDALILCHEAGRERLKSLEHVAIWPLRQLRNFYEEVASARHACQVIGVALNGRRISSMEAAEEQARIEAELGLPACDVYRDGPDRLVDAVEQFDQQVRERRGLTPVEEAVV